MNTADRNALLVLPFIILIAVGVAWAGSQGGFVAGSLPVFAVCATLAFIIQWIAFIPSYLKRTEAYYDLTGSLTYITTIAVALFLIPAIDPRAWLLAGIIGIWAARLGSFLFARIRTSGEDRRFREIRTSFTRFLLAWTLQGLWVVLTLAAALAAITSIQKPPLDIFAITGFVIWLSGFIIEVVADHQKHRFRMDPGNMGKFICSGLWSWSRHPNYFGEIILWIGVTIIALPVLRGWQWITLISPVFVAILLIKISGIPILEAHADRKWGGQLDYDSYKASTPVLFPKPPSTK